ncbi:PHB depolymerase family esterase [Cupriavidus basilensis]
MCSLRHGWPARTRPALPRAPRPRWWRAARVCVVLMPRTILPRERAAVLELVPALPRAWWPRTSLLMAVVEHAVASSARFAAIGVFALGLSAGGAMAQILGLRYPDRFAAVGSHSGADATLSAARPTPRRRRASCKARPSRRGGRATAAGGARRPRPCCWCTGMPITWSASTARSLRHR